MIKKFNERLNESVFVKAEEYENYFNSAFRNAIEELTEIGFEKDNIFIKDSFIKIKCDYRDIDPDMYIELLRFVKNNRVKQINKDTESIIFQL